MLWNNIRDAFPSEIVQLYQTLRSNGTLSYETVSRRFTDHQAKWPEAIFNEDAWFKYIMPLTDPDPGKDPTAVYLPMLLGSKAEQRKWWLYNRFRYMDSKWNAGDALTDIIQLRGYAKADITVTPYADIYPTIKYGSYLVAERGHRGRQTLLPCPLDAVNDTEIYIYSASQLASVGDLSGLKVGFADFSKAVRLQTIKVGSGDAGYVNQNLTELSVGNSKLLHTVDARNCAALTGSVDISGASNVQTVLLQGTSVTSVVLPVGGVLETLRLPGTIANLTVREQRRITLFTIEGDSYDTITTLRIENCEGIPVLDILWDMASGSRVRIIGMSTEISTIEGVYELYDRFDLMSGLDESGGNVDRAVVSGEISGVASARRRQLDSLAARYPNITVDCAFVKEGSIVRFYNGDTLLQYIDDSPNGQAATYTGATPVHPTNPSANEFIGWYPSNDYIIDETNCYAQYHDTESIVVRYLEDRIVDFDSGTMPCVGPYAFYGSSGLKTVAVRSGSIGTYAFASTNLDSVTIGTLDYIDNRAFGQASVGEFTATDAGAVRGYALYRMACDHLSLTAGALEQYALDGVSADTATVTANTVEGNAFYDMDADVLDVTVPGSGLSYNAMRNSMIGDVIIRSASYAFSTDSPALGNTLTASDEGAIYVPSGLVDTYRGKTYGSIGGGLVSHPLIVPIDQYPVTDKSTISDTWDAIIASSGNGTYASRYSVGDKKLLELSDGSHLYMHLVAMDADDLSDGSGKAHMTWLAGDVVPASFNRQMNAVNKGLTGWGGSDLRTYLRYTFSGYLPGNLRSAIKTVRKSAQAFSASYGAYVQDSDDTLWIASAREIGSTIAPTESGLMTYDDVIRGTYPSGGSFLSSTSASNNYVWTRSTDTADSSGNDRFIRLASSGWSYITPASSTSGFLLGFCI